MVGASITIVRDDEEIEVDLRGYVEYFGSYNPLERGEQISDWEVLTPGVVLSPDEMMEAEYALERNM